MDFTSAVTLLKSALVSSTKASLSARESAKSFFQLHVATEKRKWANAVYNLPANKEGVSSVRWHSIQAKPSSTDT